MPSLKATQAKSAPRLVSAKPSATASQDVPPNAALEFQLESRRIPEFRLPRRKRGTGSVFYDHTRKTFVAKLSTPGGYLRRRAKTRAAALRTLDDLIAGTPQGKRRAGQRMRRAILLGDRFFILNRDGFACRYCGATAPQARLVVDHVVSVTDGGTNDLSNLVTACQDCNLGKSGQSVDFDRPIGIHAAVQLLNRRKRPAC